MHEDIKANIRALEFGIEELEKTAAFFDPYLTKLLQHPAPDFDVKELYLLREEMISTVVIAKFLREYIEKLKLKANKKPWYKRIDPRK